jgi:hypothetical protein
MNFNDLTLSEKIAMVNVAATLMAKGIVKVNPDCMDPEEIIDALIPEAKILFNKSNLLKNP